MQLVVYTQIPSQRQLKKLQSSENSHMLMVYSGPLSLIVKETPPEEGFALKSHA